MSSGIKNRNIVVINQAVNYLTIGIANAFTSKFDTVALITGSVHVQGQELEPNIEITKIIKWKEEHGWGKLLIYLKSLFRIYYLLLTKYKKYEVFFVSLPPMGYLLNIIIKNRFSILIWDVYPESLKILGITENHIVYRLWAYLNRLSFKKAYRLFTISDKMAELLEAYVQRDKIIVQPIWSIFQENSITDRLLNPFIRQFNLQNKFIVQYSGNIGLGHNVELMIQLADRMKDYENILFQIIGRGPRVHILKQRVVEMNLPNCQFLPFQSDEMFPFSLAAADIGVVILDEIISKGSVPSKLYNLMSFGIPSLYFAASDSELMSYTEIYRNAKCFSENQIEEAVKFILTLRQNSNLYQQFSQNALNAAINFRRDNADKLVSHYLKLNV